MPNPTETPFAGIPPAAADGTLASPPSAGFPSAAADGTLAGSALVQTPRHRIAPDPALGHALTLAAAAIARLDQALTDHRLTPAFLHRARLEAVRLQAAVDGQAIDPWHLAAVLEGLRLRMDGALRIIDRGMILDAARHALQAHQWLTAPDFDQEGDVQRAEQALAPTSGTTPLLAAARGLHAWLEAGGARAPMRAALVRHWMRHRLLRAPVPLTGAAALRPDTPWREDAWVPVFLTALADEAADALQRLVALEHTWFAARRAVADRRKNSRAAAAVDLLAATPLISATTLAAGLGMAVKNATALLDRFCAENIAVEVTHRSRRRLFGLTGLAPLRDEVAPPRRPEPGRGRGRPPNLADDTVMPPLPERPMTPLERRAFDYADLEAAMAAAEATIRSVRRNLETLRGPGLPTAPTPASDPAGDAERATASGPTAADTSAADATARANGAGEDA